MGGLGRRTRPRAWRRPQLGTRAAKSRPLSGEQDPAAARPSREQLYSTVVLIFFKKKKKKGYRKKTRRKRGEMCVCVSLWAMRLWVIFTPLWGPCCLSWMALPRVGRQLWESPVGRAPSPPRPAEAPPSLHPAQSCPPGRTALADPERPQARGSSSTWPLPLAPRPAPPVCPRRPWLPGPCRTPSFPCLLQL